MKIAAALALCGILIFSATRGGPNGKEFEGYLEPEAVLVRSAMGGRVAEVLAHRGDSVRAGQVLLRLEAGDLEERVAQLRARIAKLSPERVSGATEIIERVPAATWARLAQTDPARLAAEDEYTAALSAAERHPAPASRNRLRQAARRRAAVYRQAFEPDVARLAEFRGLSADARNTLLWLDAQLERFRVRAPCDGVIELLDISKGHALGPMSGVALIDVPGRYAIKSASARRVPVGTPVTAIARSGGALHAVVAAAPDDEFLALLAAPPGLYKAGEAVRVRIP